jgi:hypothetical protein
LPPELSYSALSRLERCGYRYYLESVLGLPQTQARTRASRLPSRARGELIHRALRSLDFSRRLAVPPEQVICLARELGLPESAPEYAAIAKLLGELRRTPLAARLAAGHLRRESPFAFTLGLRDLTMTGTIDALLREGQARYLIVDYKSDRVGTGEDLEAVVAARYSIQRLVYALAGLSDGAEAVEVVHWFLHRPREWVSAAFTGAQKDALCEELRRCVQRAQQRGYTVSERPNRELCSGCPGRGTLCSWDHAQTLRPQWETQPLPRATRAPDFAV